MTTLSQDQLNQLATQLAPLLGLNASASLDDVKNNIAERLVDLNFPDTQGLFKDVYGTLLDDISNEYTITDPNTGEDITVQSPNTDLTSNSAWEFISSVASINANSLTPQDIVVREYTKDQWYLRFGTALDDDKLQQMSNGIALSIIDDIFQSGGAIPSIDNIGSRDAGEVVDQFFNGDSGGWAGNALFQNFGTGEFFVNGLDPIGPSRTTNGEDPNGTYDMFASMYSVQKSLQDQSYSTLISMWLTDTRDSVIAGNDLGTSDTEALMSDLSKQLDSWISSNYYNLNNSWSGLFSTFYNPGILDNPVISGPQLYVGKLNETDTVSISTAPNEAIVRMGNENDTVSISYHLPAKGLIDGGEGTNTLDLSGLSESLIVTSHPQISGNQAFELRAKFAGDVYAYNFQVLKAVLWRQ